MKKICFLMAILMCLSCLMVSCKDPKDPTTPDGVAPPPPATSDAFDFTDASITRPKGSATTLFSASKSINSNYLSLTGKNLSIKDDLRAATAGEILVGMTNRPESTTAKGMLPAGERFAYAIVRIENKIAIIGTTDEMTVMGVNYFISTVLKENIAEDGKLNIPKDFVYTGTAESVSVLASSTYRLVVAKALRDTVGTYADTMGKAIQTATSKGYSVSTDSKSKDESRNQNAEILVGATYYPETIQVMSSFGYHEYGIAVVGKKVVVFGFSAETLALATELFKVVVQNNIYDGQLILPQGMLVKIAVTGSGASTLQLPAYPAVLQSFADAGEGGTRIRATDTNAEEFLAYGKALANEGYTLLSQTSAGENLFFTYYKDNQTLTCSYHPVNKTADIIVDNEKNRPMSAAENQYTTITTTTFTQMSLTYVTENAGMGYVMRLADGRFIVIDGGSYTYDEHKHLYEIILKQHQDSGKGGKPVIAAWFLTHAHGDHYGNFKKFAETYCPQYVTIESAVWNMGTSESNPSLQGIAASIRTFFKNYLSKTQVYFARTGQRYNIANVTVDVLFTPDDLDIGTAENNSSCYFKITVDNNQTIMITGDSEAKAADYMSKRYAAGGLASDIMQQAHHGYWAGSVELYKLINPEVVFWPSPARWYYALYDDTFDRAWGSLASNKWITVESQKVKQIILAGLGDYTISLPHTAIESKPHTASTTYADGTVIFHQDFETSELYNTGVGVVESHHETFNGTGFSLEAHNGQRSLYWKGGANSGLRLITPEMVRGNDIVTLTLDLDIKTLGNGLSIWYNDANIENTKNASFYSIDKSGSVEIAIEINRANGTYKVYVNDQLYAQGNNASNDAGFICLLSKGAEIYINEITLTAGTFAQSK